MFQQGFGVSRLYCRWICVRERKIMALARAVRSDGRACLPMTTCPLAGNYFAEYPCLPSL